MGAGQLGQKLQIRSIIIVGEKSLLPAVAPLCYMMGDPRSHGSRYSRHGRILAFLSFVVNKKYGVPGTPEKYYQEEQLHFDFYCPAAKLRGSFLSILIPNKNKENTFTASYFCI
jgi:hypothetical protein